MRAAESSELILLSLLVLVFAYAQFGPRRRGDDSTTMNRYARGLLVHAGALLLTAIWCYVVFNQHFDAIRSDGNASWLYVILAPSACLVAAILGLVIRRPLQRVAQMRRFVSRAKADLLRCKYRLPQNRLQIVLDKLERLGFHRSALDLATSHISLARWLTCFALVHAIEQMEHTGGKLGKYVSRHSPELTMLRQSVDGLNIRAMRFLRLRMKAAEDLRHRHPDWDEVDVVDALRNKGGDSDDVVVHSVNELDRALSETARYILVQLHAFLVRGLVITFWTRRKRLESLRHLGFDVEALRQRSPDLLLSAIAAFVTIVLVTLISTLLMPASVASTSDAVARSVMVGAMFLMPALSVYLTRWGGRHSRFAEKWYGRLIKDYLGAILLALALTFLVGLAYSLTVEVDVRANIVQSVQDAVWLRLFRVPWTIVAIGLALALGIVTDLKRSVTTLSRWRDALLVGFTMAVIVTVTWALLDRLNPNALRTNQRLPEQYVRDWADKVLDNNTRVLTFVEYYEQRQHEVFERMASDARPRMVPALPALWIVTFVASAILGYWLPTWFLYFRSEEFNGVL